MAIMPAELCLKELETMTAITAIRSSAKGTQDRIPCAFTVDVEDYYMVTAFEKNVRFEDWPCHEGRTSANTDRILDLLDACAVKATFFVLGWVAEREPSIVRAIAVRGHEVACHGYRHRMVTTLEPEEFREDVRRAKALIETISGAPVVGFRAPSWSIVADTMWALDVLIEEGFAYDSSIFPIHHDRYGVPGAARFPHVITRPSGSIREYPPSTLRVAGVNFPVAGGGYLRLYPLWFTRWALRRINRRKRHPCVIYVHPWEVDPGQPRMSCGRMTGFRHYVGLSRTFGKLRVLLREFAFVRLCDLGA